MVSGYHFSQQGRLHRLKGIACQDFSLFVKRPDDCAYAVVADGVGSCRHPDIAARLAVRTVAGLLDQQLLPISSGCHLPENGPSFEERIINILKEALHEAANAIECYAGRHEDMKEEDLQTTLSIAVLYNDGTLYYGNAGDSGIVALSDDGWQVLTTKNVDSLGRVYSMPMFRCFEVGKAGFPAKAILCLTDGLLESVAPEILSAASQPVNVPFVNLFISSWFDTGEESSESAATDNRTFILDYLSSSECEGLLDDFSAAVAVVDELMPESPEEIAWKEPELDPYQLKARELSIYPDEISGALFMEYIHEENPGIEETEAGELFHRYMNMPQ